VQVYLVDFGGPGETQVDGFGESRYGVVRNLFLTSTWYTLVQSGGLRGSEVIILGISVMLDLGSERSKWVKMWFHNFVCLSIPGSYTCSLR